jgi:hypothetical protein
MNAFGIISLEMQNYLESLAPGMRDELQTYIDENIENAKNGEAPNPLEDRLKALISDLGGDVETFEQIFFQLMSAAAKTEQDAAAPK